MSTCTETLGASGPLETPAAQSRPVTETKAGWVVAFAALYGLVFGPSAILVTGFGVLASPIAKGFEWSMGQVTSAVSVIALSIVAIAPLQGFLIDRFGTRRVVLASVMAFSVALAAMSSLPKDLVVFHVAWGVMVAAAVGLWPAAYLKVVSGWFDRRMGLAIGIANSGIPIGAALVSPIAAYVIEGWGWRTAFMVLAGCVASTLPVLYLGFKEPPQHGASKPAALGQSTPARPVSVLTTLWPDTDFRLLAISFLLIGFTGTGMVANLVPLLVGAGLTPKTAVGLMSVYGLSSLAARLVTGALLDRIFAGRLMNLFVVGAMIASVIFALGSNSIGLTLATMLVGFIMGAEFDILAYVLRRYFAAAVFGRAFGTIFAVFQLGAALGAAFLSYGLQTWGSYRPGMIAFVVALALSVVFVGRLRPYRMDIFGKPLAA